MPELGPNENALQIAHRAGLCPFHIVVPQLALGKANRDARFTGKEAGSFLGFQQLSELIPQLCCVMAGPQHKSQVS